ncbi:MAG: ABC transporter permease subunit, partial [Acidimicrobiia bacterium]|nr:ABC transporter permease subunit [Acidimicrobiia bacterium]
MTARPPLWRDVRVLQWAFQLVVVAFVVAIIAWLGRNVRANSADQGIPLGLDFLDQPAGFTIPGSEFRQTQSVRDALVIGVGTTVRVSVVGIALSTLLGVLIGIGRLSGNWLVRNAARLYVEAFRNVPVFLLIVFAYLALVLAVFPRIQEAWEPFGVAVLSNRGVVIPWLTNAGWSFVALVAVAVVLAWLVARWRRAVSDRTGRSAATGLWAAVVLVAVAALGGRVLGLGISVP